MTTYAARERASSRHLSDAEFRSAPGAGTLDREVFLSYHAAEYVMAPPTTLGPFSHYDREEMILATKRQVERLLTLRRPNWDTYGARPVSPDALDRATRLVLDLVDHEIRTPRLYPLSDGGVRLEWAGPDGEAWIDIPATDEATYYLLDETTAVEQEGALVDVPARMWEFLLSLR